MNYGLDECDERIHGGNMKRYDAALKYIGTGEYVPASEVAEDGDFVFYADHLAALESVRQESAQRIAELEAQARDLHETNLQLVGQIAASVHPESVIAIPMYDMTEQHKLKLDAAIDAAVQGMQTGSVE